MRHSMLFRLLLIFTLLFVQTGGLMHEISHIVVNQPHADLPHEKHCDLCAAYAQIGSALGSHFAPFKVTEQTTLLIDTSPKTRNATPAFSAFAARAPPHSA